MKIPAECNFSALPEYKYHESAAGELSRREKNRGNPGKMLVGS